jgi:arsenate reductase
MKPQKPFKILFLCTGNSARSILAEYLIRKIGQGRFESFSAGSDPRGSVNPYAIRILKDIYRIDAEAARSKAWNGFLDTQTDFDFVITVCDDAKESCPVFPGQPVTAHWSSPDPATFEGDDRAIYNFFVKVALQIQRRIELLCCLPFEKLDALRLQQMTREIGDSEKFIHPHHDHP